MNSLAHRLSVWSIRVWATFSYVGLAAAAMFFAASLTPSLLPRNFAVQGILSGFALAVGYGFGVLVDGLWNYLEIRNPNAGIQYAGKRITTVGVALTVA